MSGLLNQTGAVSGILGTITQTTGDVTLTGTQTLTNKTLTSPVIDTGVSGTANIKNPCCKMYMTNSYGSNAGALFITGYTQFVNDDAALFTQGATSTNGITIATAGVYAWSTWLYTDSPSAFAYMRVYLALNASSEIGETMTIQSLQTADTWNALGRSDVIELATGTYGLYKFSNTGNHSLNGSSSANSTVSLTWMGT